MKQLSVRTGTPSNTNQILAISVKYSSCLCLLIIENYQNLETRPSCKSFHYISAINNNDENKDGNTNVDISNSNDNANNPVILQMNTQLFLTRNQAFTYRE